MTAAGSTLDVAAVVGALDHPVRLRVIAELERGRVHVSELARRLRVGRPLLHMHLRRLEGAGLVTSSLELSPDGKAMRVYSVAPFDVHLTPHSVAAAAYASTDRSHQI